MFLYFVLTCLLESLPNTVAAERMIFPWGNQSFNIHFASNLQPRKLWDHMSKMAAVLHHTSEVMTSQLPPSSYLAIKELLASPTWRYSHHCDQRMHTADVPQTVITGSDIGRECFEIAGTYTSCFSWKTKTKRSYKLNVQSRAVPV